MRILRPLDRYVFTEFSKIFIATALGFPIVLIIVAGDSRDLRLPIFPAPN